MIQTGERIPDFSIPDQSGQPRTFKQLAGKKGLVLYAYPKDNTSGCTVEAQEFNAVLAELAALGFNLAGISRDSVKSHCNFTDKYDLKFPLLADQELTLLAPLGAFGEKKMYGKPVQGIIRSTFVFDPKGKAVKVYPNVKSKGHAQAVLDDLKAL